jgi:hypothetical protein
MCAMSDPYHDEKNAAAQTTALARLAFLLKLVRTDLMIAILKSPGFDHRKRTQRLDGAACNHAFEFSGSNNVLSGDLAITAN